MTPAFLRRKKKASYCTVGKSQSGEKDVVVLRPEVDVDAVNVAVKKKRKLALLAWVWLLWRIWLSVLVKTEVGDEKGDVGYEREWSDPGSKKTFLVIAQPPATPAQIPELMAICLVPRVLLNIAPLKAPATTLLVMSCLPR